MLIKIQRVVNSFYASCTYVIDVGLQGVWVVDVGDVEPLIKSLNDRQVTGVLLTHGHYDHIYGLNELCALFPQAKVYTNEIGFEMLLNEKMNLSKFHDLPFTFAFPERIKLVNDNDEIPLGNDIIAKVLATPGHHPSCLCYIIDNVIFSGDAYIPGIKVVTNLPKGNKIQAQLSVERILQHAKGRTILSGHAVK